MRGRTWIVESGDAGVRLDKFLAHSDRLESRGDATAALERGKVFINEIEASLSDRGRKLRDGDRVRVWMDRPGTAHRRGGRRIGPPDLHIVYEDDTLAVVNKPAGLLTVPLPIRGDEPSVEDELVVHLRSHGKRRPLVVHRIDRDTSGLVIFAKRADAQRRLKEQFKRHEAERVYLAVVYGHPSPASGTWRDHVAWDQRSLIQKETHASDPRAAEARSEYRVLESFESASLIEVRLVTGKRNQIRLQARLRGHTLVGERRYIYGPDEIRPIPFPRQALHAHRLTLRHPVDGRSLRFEAPVPHDLADLIRRLRRRS
jgi:23S rRNA pseudouridine1911/1915/1917 synthase